MKLSDVWVLLLWLVMSTIIGVYGGKDFQNAVLGADAGIAIALVWFNIR